MVFCVGALDIAAPGTDQTLIIWTFATGALAEVAQRFNIVRHTSQATEEALGELVAVTHTHNLLK
jgi:hypothetical protein